MTAIEENTYRPEIQSDHHRNKFKLVLLGWNSWQVYQKVLNMEAKTWEGKGEQDWKAE